jgi:predicted dithiol-disulfide oxidoreductase (DUF899 family)
MLEQLPPIAVYQTYSAGARRAESLMGYYAILDRVPKKPRVRWAPAVDPRHDEYDSQ